MKVRSVAVALVLVGTGFAYGHLGREVGWPPYDESEPPEATEHAREARAPKDAAPPPAAPAAVRGARADPAMASQLEALGYLASYEAAPDERGVVVHDAGRAWNAPNLYTSGHGPEAVLMDMEGKVLHTWRCSFHEAFPEADPEGDEPPAWWRRAHLLEDGHLLAIFGGRGIVELDGESKVMWSHAGGEHHDLHVLADGTIHVLAAERTERARARYGAPVAEDLVEVLSPDGEVLRRVSLVEALVRSDYARFLDRIPPIRGDEVLLHTNTIEVLDGRLADRSDAFRAGNVLVSMRSIDTIAVVDLAEERVVWALAGPWHRQHQPTLLRDGDLLLFDNQGPNGFSRVLELDPFTQEVAWSYEGDAANGFRSRVLGSCQRLPNGNTLVTQSTSGRAFEVTPDGTVVWDFRNPRSAPGDEGEIAVIYENVRLERGRSLDWLE